MHHLENVQGNKKALQIVKMVHVTDGLQAVVADVYIQYISHQERVIARHYNASAKVPRLMPFHIHKWSFGF